MLLVEDEFLIRLILAEALIDAGFHVVEAGSGQEAVQILQSEPGLRTDDHGRANA